MKTKFIILAALLIAGSACKSELDGKAAAKVADVPAATTAAPTAPDGAPKAASRTVPFDPAQTMVEWTANKVTKDHKGGFRNVQGAATFAPDGSVEKLTAKIDTTSVYSDVEKLTNHLKKPDFLDVEKFPTSTFETTRIVKGEGNEFTVTGILDLHGAQKEITFPARIEIAEGKMVATAEFKLQRFDFGIEYKGAADDLVNPEVLLSLHVVADVPAES